MTISHWFFEHVNINVITILSLKEHCVIQKSSVYNIDITNSYRLSLKLSREGPQNVNKVKQYELCSS